MVELGHRAAAAEPSEGMRAVLRAGLDGGKVSVMDARAESLPVDDNAFDAVICLQAWHWVETEDDEPLRIPGFSAARPHRRPYVMELRPADLATQIGSWSHVALHPERDQILADVVRLAERASEADGLVRLPHLTTSYRTQAAA